GAALFGAQASVMPEWRQTSIAFARFIRIFSLPRSLDKIRQPQTDAGSSWDYSFGSRSLDDPAGTRHARFTADNRLDRSAHRARCSEAAAVPDHALLCDHGTCRTSDVSRILEARAWRFSPLVACFPPFLLLRRDDSGS